MIHDYTSKPDDSFWGFLKKALTVIVFVSLFNICSCGKDIKEDK